MERASEREREREKTCREREWDDPALLPRERSLLSMYRAQYVMLCLCAAYAMERLEMRARTREAGSSRV